MLKIFFYLTLSYHSSLYAQSMAEKIQDKNVTQELIQDASISKRCENLMQDRQGLMNKKKKLTGLMKRAESVIHKIPPTREQMKSRTEVTRSHIKQELDLVELQLHTMEENIVRKGCPGINL